MFGQKKLKDEIAHLELLRTIDKECIIALLDLVDLKKLDTYEASLVEQTLEQ